MLAIIIFTTFGFFTYHVDQATEHGTRPLTKAALVRELEPILPAESTRFND